LGIPASVATIGPGSTLAPQNDSEEV
jgi:hypothetical protein